MAAAPKTVALIVAGIVVVGGGFIAAPMLGDAFTTTVGPNAPVLGDPIEFEVNANGETYGSPFNERVPDLMLTRSDGGTVGYVRVSELDLARNARNSSTNPDAIFEVAVYRSDGETQIGVYRVRDDTAGPRDGVNK